MIKSIIKAVQHWRELRRRRPELEHVTIDSDNVMILHTGATEAWSPRAEIKQAGPGTLELSDEETALRELRPMLDDFHRAMAAAFRQFDAGLLAPMATTHRWHVHAGDACVRCAEYRARTFGPIGERFGIRSFRLDTATAEYKIYNPHPVRA